MTAPECPRCHEPITDPTECAGEPVLHCGPCANRCDACLEDWAREQYEDAAREGSA